MTCHHGYTLQHAIAIFLELAVSAGLIASRHAPLRLRVVASAGPFTAVVYHALLAAVCASPSVSAELDAYWHTHPLFRLRMIFVFTSANFSLAGLASCYIILGSDKFKGAKLATVGVFALVSACLVHRILKGGFEDSLFWRDCGATVGATSVLFSWRIIHAATGSTAMTWCVYPICGLVVSAALLRKAYSLDIDGRVAPHTAEDATHPHWAAPLFFTLANSGFLIAHAAVAHAISKLAPAAISFAANTSLFLPGGHSSSSAYAAYHPVPD